jgi:hypothetical protein
VTVKVVEGETKTAVEDFEVRLGVYRASTNRSGLARLDVAKGSYNLSVWKSGYKAVSKRLDVDENMTISVEVSLEPQSEEPYWM